MQVLAPAKINLSLRILGRRSDGFHEIETLIAPISLYDEIKVEKRSGKTGIAFRCDVPSVPQGDDNLVVRAAKAFVAKAKIDAAISIELQKKIPHGAGLGGGSSDAASTLLALNELFETNLPREALSKIAETIGSDIPFFIFQSAAVCKGRGELVTAPKATAKPIAVIAQTGLCRFDFLGISPLARLSRRSKSLLRGSRIRGPDFRQRPRASGF